MSRGVDRVYKGAVIEPQRKPEQIYGGKKEENRFKIVQIKHAVISDLLQSFWSIFNVLTLEMEFISRMRWFLFVFRSDEHDTANLENIEISCLPIKINSI